MGKKREENNEEQVQYQGLKDVVVGNWGEGRGGDDKIKEVLSVLMLCAPITVGGQFRIVRK